MKFLVFAMCVCAANAAAFKPSWQPIQQGAQAIATAVVTEPEVVAKAVYAPFKATVVEPVVKSSVYVDKNANDGIVRSESEVSADGFRYAYETANGISAESKGALKKVGNDEFLAVQGAFRYYAPDGTPVEFTYIADENGYQPQSNFLPVAPAIPEQILRSLEYIRTHPQKYDEKY